MVTKLTLADVKKAHDALLEPKSGVKASLLLRAVYKSAFDVVGCKADWKGPVSYRLDGTEDYEADVFCAAVEFFTGAPCKLTFDGYVESRGYRAGPAGDH